MQGNAGKQHLPRCTSDIATGGWRWGRWPGHGDLGGPSWRRRTSSPTGSRR